MIPQVASRLGLAALAATLVFAQPIAALASPVQSTVDAQALPKDKQNVLNLHVTAKEAAAVLVADPKAILIDTRTLAEVAFLGLPEQTARVIPFAHFTAGAADYDAKRQTYVGKPNPNFVAEVEALMAEKGLGKDTTVLLLCRSGNRSSKAVDLLAKAGYTRAYNIVDGFEGDTDKDGRRTVNGWKNAGLPWTYTISPAQAYKPVQ